MRFDADLVRQEILNLLISYPELASDELLRADMIEGATSAYDFLRIVEQRRQEAASMAGAIASNIAELGLRQERFERREKAMRAIAFKIMEAADLKKLEMPEATYSVRNGQQKVIGDLPVENIPSEFLRVKRELDRSLLKTALQAGRNIEGFTLSNAEPSLSIRTK